MIYILIIICGVLAGVFLNKESKGQYVPAVILKGLASLCFVILKAMKSTRDHEKIRWIVKS